MIMAVVALAASVAACGNSNQAATLPAKERPTALVEGLSMYLSKDVYISKLGGDDTAVVNYIGECSPAGICPTFTAMGPEFLNKLSGHWQETLGDLPECSPGGGASTHGPIVAKGTKNVGGKQTEYYEAQLCGPEAPQEVVKFWKLPNLLIQTTERGSVRVKGFDDLLASAILQ